MWYRPIKIKFLSKVVCLKSGWNPAAKSSEAKEITEDTANKKEDSEEA